MIGSFQCRTRLCWWCKLVVPRGCQRCCGFNAARGFVGGASSHSFIYIDFISSFQCRTRLCWWCKAHIIDNRCTFFRFNAARGFVGGARSIAVCTIKESSWFQCRTRLCWWCKLQRRYQTAAGPKFQCRTRLCWWCKRYLDRQWNDSKRFNAARGFVGGARYYL